MKLAILSGVRYGRAGSAVIGLVVVAGLLAASGTANADAGDVNASDCLTGDAGPYDLVAESSFGWFRTISLYCGDETKGVFHIVRKHVIDEDGADDDNVVACMDAILYYGDEVEAKGEGNEAYEAKRADGGTAGLAWDENTDEVVTMYTSDPGGNNWAACAEYVGA